MKYSGVVLAAGKGVRMKSDLPKVVHKVAGKPMVVYVVEALKGAGIDDITVVVGHKREMVEEVLKPFGVKFALQEEQMGTGHALLQAKDKVDMESNLVVLAGDTPLLEADTIKNLISFHTEGGATATVLSTALDEPYGYGRIVRDENANLLKIVEEKDASPEEKKIREINSGIYCFKAKEVFDTLLKLNTSNAQGEYYLTDVFAILREEGRTVKVLKAENSEEIYGINDKIQLSYAEKIMRQRKNKRLMQEGVIIVDPDSTFIDGQVKIGRDTVIMPWTFIEGETVIGKRCEIGPLTRITSSRIGNDVVVENSRIKEAEIKDKCIIGPFAYLRPGTVLNEEVKIGDFVEVKKSIIGKKSKIPHLSYVGDALLGEEVNIGAGTITCNYDGVNKHQTIIEDKAFIGSNTNLVAPVRIGENAVTGAGSTITRDVPADALAVERAEQRLVKGWSKRKNKKE
ncbi:bifunctional UDP-N-acetylglucosamine diphosphorylase/glucosamine-1-phosphate N-acetyltransferase GlmU [Thermosyntropha sp.]|uniref:bifunctional UDP-N-acetylglucosamine diphosphorylase/glucosamine-1-phosphate N-acetyltransferase GlmU n=1 Tax=Thermosyntropha sp. TaxID=2740820 RepID=UPI0025D464ED|nr:bifunctional UDP-N-acetylglucosamine diphosphorylase/glucosamine-1-phosphate N-acetyltransferase GlmU [Thermosyntropha sp.]MBO8159783.1 bifunctional UDP-N-acetylglucosamine diphosphorylase/glucosamine-1-phosphate N-acetyltransferase GlmU [Thermosyntropha sp.]